MQITVQLCIFLCKKGEKLRSSVLNLTGKPCIVKPTDYGHAERAFFRKSQTFWLGQTNWAVNFGAIWGIFDQTISTHFGTVSPVPCPCFPSFNHYFYKKLSLYIHIPNTG